MCGLKIGVTVFCSVILEGMIKTKIEFRCCASRGAVARTRKLATA